MSMSGCARDVERACTVGGLQDRHRRRYDREQVRHRIAYQRVVVDDEDLHGCGRGAAR
jgi:hypothetical protein